MKFAFASALLAAAVFAADKTDAEHAVAGGVAITADLAALDLTKTADKAQKKKYDDWYATKTVADKTNLAEAISKDKDGNALADDEKKILKEYTDIMGGALNLAMAGVATLGAVFLL